MKFPFPLVVCYLHSLSKCISPLKIDFLVQQVKLLTKTKFNYTYAEDEPVSTFVTAFYDAVLLYAYALNDSIGLLGEQRALKQPINGTYLTHLMWGKSFKGITGNVTIDSNGDRISDYSLLDLNPETGMFEVSG